MKKEIQIICEGSKYEIGEIACCFFSYLIL